MRVTPRARQIGASKYQSSGLDKGTTFTVYLPVTAQTAAAMNNTEVVGSVESVPTGVRAQRQAILYLDDEEAVASMVKKILERTGYRVSSFVKQDEAIAALRAAPDAFHLVVTDYNMPGMSGLDVAREVRAIRADLPVAVTSGFVDIELRKSAVEVGVREIIFKADDLDAFCGAVQRLVEGAAEAAQLHSQN